MTSSNIKYLYPLFGIFLTNPALAQSSGQQGQESAQGEGIQDIVVTAQRRAETALSVPLSIQVASGEQLENIGVKDLTGLQFTTPGYLPVTNSGFTQIFIRGIGNSIFVGADPSVATFIDDVPRLFGSMADNLVDVERVEILKGAQGGLYGRNATGGVVNIITRSPKLDAFSGEARISYGEKQTFRGSASLNLPLGKTMALSIAGERASHDPYIKNIARKNPYSAAMFPNGSTQFGTPQQTADFFNAGVTPRNLNDQNFWAVRGKLLWEPADNFKLVLAADYYNKRDANGQGSANFTPTITQNAVAGLFRSIGITTAFPADFFQTPGKFEVSSGADIRVYIKEYGVSATATLNTETFDFTWISAYRHQSTLFTGSLANGDVIEVKPLVRYPTKEYMYQEFRAISAFDGPLQVIAGATYLESHINGTSATFRLSPALPLGLTAIDQRVSNWTAYAVATYDFTIRLSLTASGRYLSEDNRARFTKPVFSIGRASERKFIPSATLNYKLDSGTVYLRWARGFKNGGINVATAPAFFPSETGSIFGPETVDTYEGGFKTALAHNRVQLTGAVFYNDYRGLQSQTQGLPAYPAIALAIINAKSARTYGAEGSIAWRVADGVNFGANVGYLNAKYKDFSLSGSAVLAPFNLNGRTIPKSPEWQYSFTANLDRPINDSLRFVASGLLSRISGVVFGYSANQGVLPDALGPGYWLANGRIGMKTADDRYSVALVADNIFNEAYYISGNAGAQGNSRVWGNPRIIRAEVGVKF